eukprot:3127334-Alexandrium_andersonii.AAC.1
MAWSHVGHQLPDNLRQLDSRHVACTRAAARRCHRNPGEACARHACQKRAEEASRASAGPMSGGCMTRPSWQEAGGGVDRGLKGSNKRVIRSASCVFPAPALEGCRPADPLLLPRRAIALPEHPESASGARLRRFFGGSRGGLSSRGGAEGCPGGSSSPGRRRKRGGSAIALLLLPC